MTRTIHLYLSLAGVLVLAALGGCAAEELSPIPVQSSQPIVNGTTTASYAPVGALTLMHPGWGYSGSFCTATKIANSWLLTAAHCLDNDVGGVTLTPGIVRFYVGADANSPAPGTLHEVDGFYLHPNYNPGTNLNDIALVHLTSPLAGTNYAINTTAMGGSWVGTVLKYVGYGVNDGINQTGGGVKRQGDISVLQVYTRTYMSDAAGANVGVCFGDSGGPGLISNAGAWNVVGVNSTVGSSSGDPCLGVGNHTRVDYFATWVSGITGGTLPSCTADPNMCYCAAACQTNGSCNNSLCEVLDCAEINFCMDACQPTDGGCYTDCYLQGTAAGRSDFDDITQCAIDHNCYNAADYQTCMSTHCQSVIDVCFATTTGTLTCELMYDCMVACPSGDQACVWGCYNTGTAAAQTQYDNMQACFDAQCSTITDPAQWQDCVWQSCAVEIEICLPPENCDIAGGDCAAAEACWPTLGGNTDCYPSDEDQLGQTCVPNQTSSLSCDDGLLCASWQGNTCVQLCQDDQDCAAQEVCDFPVFQGITDIGWCNCLDADNDGECAQTDCDDNDAATHHGAAEACGDGLDNNCDGQVDEGCSTCTDVDNDGYCDTVDCNDNDPLVNPGVVERCGDSVDNNCDGQVDEGCTTCTDADGDGYCFEVDCDDNDAGAYPGAAEICGDGIDNNCNGLVDEGCSGCTDIDQDGACDDVDCDDLDSRAFPGNTEVCDGIDNNCDGQIDEVCGGASKRGGCSAAGPAPGAPGFLMLLGLLALLPFRHRRR
jgi:uncharacterized protein (TIGR03382 family)